MKKEMDTLFLMGLVGIGAIIMSTLAVFKQWIIVAPLAIAVIFLAFLTLYQNRAKFNHLAESLEKAAFIIALIAFIVAFIYLYRPA